MIKLLYFKFKEVDRMKFDKEEEEVALLNFYMEDIKALRTVDEEEKRSLMKRVSSGEREAVKLLTEAYLMKAIQLAARYRGRGLGLADLIQEANVGLMEAMGKEQITEESILASIESSLKRAIEKECLESEKKEQLVERMNLLSDTAKEWTKRYGKEPTVRELAEYLHLTVEEVKQEMKLSLDVLSVHSVSL